MSQIPTYKSSIQRSQHSKSKLNGTRIDEETKEKIILKIVFLEKKVKFEKLFETVPKDTKFLLGVYILYNLQFLHVKTQENSDVSEHINETEFDMKLPEQVENFLELSSNTTHCLENYVEKQSEVSCESAHLLTKHADPHEINIEIAKHFLNYGCGC